MSIDHASGISTPKTDPVFLYAKVEIGIGRGHREHTDETLRMADVVSVIGDDKNPKVPWSF